MGLGSTAKKIQTLSDSAEQMYRQVQDLQKRIVGLEEEVDDTHDTVKRIEHRLEEQRALLIAMAHSQDIDAESILAEAAIDEAEKAEASDSEGDASTDETADDSATSSADASATAESNQ